MILAILSFAVQIIFIAVTNALNKAGTLTREFAIFVIVSFVLCTLTSIGCIFFNASRIKKPNISKGVSVTGLVFSIVGAMFGLIFCITCFATMAALLS